MDELIDNIKNWKDCLDCDFFEDIITYNTLSEVLEMIEYIIDTEE